MLKNIIKVSNHNIKTNNLLFKSYFSTNNNASSPCNNININNNNINNNINNNNNIFFENTIEIKNLPSNITTKDIWNEFKHSNISPNNIKSIFDGENGFFYVSFQNSNDYSKALKKSILRIENQAYPILPIINNNLFSLGNNSINIRNNNNNNNNNNGNSINTITQESQEQKISYLNRTAVTDHLWRARENKKIDPNLKTVPTLVTKTPSDSYTEVDLLFSSDLALREMYLSPFGHLRMGRLLEDLDALAAHVSFKHAENEGDGFKKIIVTASVDKIRLLRPLIPDRDLKLEGRVTWVGNTSMEIMIKVRSKNPETLIWEPVLVAYFSMVARDPLLNKSTPVNHLAVKSIQEKKLFDEAKKHKQIRLNNQQISLEKTVPNPSELQTIHHFFQIAKQPQFTDDLHLIPMKSTVIHSVILCQPQEKNINGSIFGGYLMRQGFQIAYSCVSLKFNESLPRFIAMDDISFLLPVEIGDILSLESMIVYSCPIQSQTKAYYAQVEVKAYVTNPLIGEKKLSNIFNFTFLCSPSKKALQDDNATNNNIATKTKQILPQTYEEAMIFLSGKRIVDRQIESSKDNESWLDDQIDI
ncbi:hypothetical protein DICPUDRAFT_151354 [Dictyostelium purpureum]|uniref:HotDog ACOT-type domain-containing protein n=1 Tax=Dictyostelium purpureum TaxID=5786 RepID=F0ZIL8_DICPU|nr:uncharacterized protein DICPUDRAFT_151354 [Dictyostelium purpureum]EGC36211.1 hypothetical protein DICPUDRAFT_151354 [Dictyostelium purpureum]|eukprot:XP_003287278.1 hypothetical protein DICPUDRAFT_151354 [Dictyostelium purpureum]